VGWALKQKYVRKLPWCKHEDEGKENENKEKWKEIGTEGTGKRGSSKKAMP
jgi:hypothetical protein